MEMRCRHSRRKTVGIEAIVSSMDRSSAQPELVVLVLGSPTSVNILRSYEWYLVIELRSPLWCCVSSV